MGIDLHIHSSFSDGLMTPEELVKEFIRLDLTIISIADHDTMAGVPKFQELTKDTGITYIPGTEINTEVPGDEIHILGYGIDHHNTELLDFMTVLRGKRIERVKRIVEKLNQLGKAITYEEVCANCKGDSLGRPHIAFTMMKKGWVSTVVEAFQKYIAYGKPAYVPREGIDPAEAIKAIKNAGGLAVLAHPGLLQKENIIQEMIALGIDGLEAFYPEHSHSQERRFKQLAKENNLIVTGGSDFHGWKSHKSRQLGRSFLEMEDFQEFAARLNNHGIPKKL